MVLVSSSLIFIGSPPNPVILIVTALLWLEPFSNKDIGKARSMHILMAAIWPGWPSVNAIWTTFSTTSFPDDLMMISFNSLIRWLSVFGKVRGGLAANFWIVSFSGLPLFFAGVGSLVIVSSFRFFWGEEAPTKIFSQPHPPPPYQKCNKKVSKHSLIEKTYRSHFT